MSCGISWFLEPYEDMTRDLQFALGIKCNGWGSSLDFIKEVLEESYANRNKMIAYYSELNTPYAKNKIAFLRSLKKNKKAK